MYKLLSSYIKQCKIKYIIITFKTFGNHNNEMTLKLLNHKKLRNSSVTYINLLIIRIQEYDMDYSEMSHTV